MSAKILLHMKVVKVRRKIIILIIALVIVVVAIVLGSRFNIFHPNRSAVSPSPSPQESPLFEDFHLLVPSLNIEAPVIADVDGANQKKYFKALENGVAQLKGSSKPGDGSNIFIFGHSSFYWYKPGNYKTIFAKLENIKIGDEIILWYGNIKYVYIVTEKKVVDPQEVDVLKSTSEEQVSLMTCVPPGTTWHRLIVVGKLKKD